jgi:hypothetical protein
MSSAFSFGMLNELQVGARVLLLSPDEERFSLYLSSGLGPPCAVSGQDLLALLQQLVLSLLNTVNKVTNAAKSNGRQAISGESYFHYKKTRVNIQVFSTEVIKPG